MPIYRNNSRLALAIVRDEADKLEQYLREGDDPNQDPAVRNLAIRIGNSRIISVLQLYEVSITIDDLINRSTERDLLNELEHALLRSSPITDISDEEYFCNQLATFAPDPQTDEMQKLLRLAIQKQQNSKLGCILNHGVPAMPAKRTDTHAITVAAEYGNLAAIRMLDNAGAEPTVEGFIAAVHRGYFQAARALYCMAHNHGKAQTYRIDVMREARLHCKRHERFAIKNMFVNMDYKDKHALIAARRAAKVQSTYAFTA